MATRATKPEPLEAFKLNMEDAYRLVLIAEALTNQRQRRMRLELRKKIGDVLRIRASEQDRLDCVQSDDACVILLPGSRLTRQALSDQRPLLRQALVAGCAAMETFVFDVAMQNIGALLRSHDAASVRLKQVQMSVGDWLYIEQYYERRRRGLRERVVSPYMSEFASTSPKKVGEVLSMLGVSGWARQVDRGRGVPQGRSVEALDRITARRNRIAHQGDRQGFGRALITIDEVRSELSCLESIVAGIDVLLRSSLGTIRGSVDA